MDAACATIFSDESVSARLDYFSAHLLYLTVGIIIVVVVIGRHGDWPLFVISIRDSSGMTLSAYREEGGNPRDTYAVQTTSKLKLKDLLCLFFTFRVEATNISLIY